MLRTEPTVVPQERAALRFCYQTVPGRLLLKLLCRPGLSRLAGRFLDTRASCPLIAPFVRSHGIDLADYEPATYRCFNDFFCRKIRPELRPIDRDPAALIAPCDGLLSAYSIHAGTVIPVKQSRYTISSLLGGDPLAARYHGGLCLVFRLCVEHYHRYCYLDDGLAGQPVFLPGQLHTVRPIALEQVPVFVRNSRVYTPIETDHFGPVIQMEVGAMLVGKIHNHAHLSRVGRGAEKGMFLYGGSTVIVLLPADRARLDFPLDGQEEYPVRLGQRIGTQT